uniref:Uncharacterized protein n=1 Tax=Timema cristinae TaxID=61476 RepID=A0A7R9H413_TIMCR|nr:unnamed protein product [Timema cristinae]
MLSPVGRTAGDGQEKGGVHYTRATLTFSYEVPLFRDVQNPVVMSTAVEIAPTPFMPGRSLSQDQSTMTSFDRIGLSLARANKRLKQPAIFKEDPRVGFDEEAEEEEVSVHHISRINSGALVHGDVVRKELKSRVDEEVDLDEPEIKVDLILSEQPSREPTKKPGFFAELFKLFPCLDNKRTTSSKSERLKVWGTLELFYGISCNLTMARTVPFSSKEEG